MKRFFRNNGLSLFLLSLFLVFWGLQAFCGWHVHNEEEILHGKASISFPQYLTSGHFWQATGENWESEFLQMGAYVILTTFLFQKGSAESEDPDRPEGEHPAEDVMKFSFLRCNSLSLALLGLFVSAFVIHAWGGLIEENEKRLENHQPLENITSFLSGGEF